MLMNGKVTAKVTVKNSGPRDGKEIVQLYIHDIYSTSTRPVKELKAFRKIFPESRGKQGKSLSNLQQRI